MGFISKLLGLISTPASPTQKRAPEAVIDRAGGARRARNVKLEDSWLTVGQPAFFGQAHVSHDKRWVVGCSDSDGVSRGGHRESGNGRVILVDHQSDKVMHELKSFARPMDAAVSDVGSYFVHDGGFGSALQGDVVAIGIDGCERYRKRYSANIFNLGLSKCGRYAVVQTANAPSADGNLLEVLDFERSCAVFSVQPSTGWADGYLFDVDSDGQFRALGVEHKGLGKFSYSATGEFQDTHAFQSARLTRGDYTMRISAARDLLKEGATPENAKKALTAADAALADGAKDRPDWGSIAHRVRGESYELLGQMPEALAAYEQALSLNPKVGVQKRISGLRKTIAAG